MFIVSLLKNLRLWAALGLLVILAGCATSGFGGGAASGEIQTAVDDTDARKRARTRLTLAASYYEHGQPTVALDEVKRAIQADSSFADAYNLSGLIYLALNEQGMAQNHFERAISLNPRDGNAIHNLGWLQCQQGQYAAAAQSFQRALAIPSYTERPKTMMAQGVCEARGGDLAQAEATLMRSYELDAGNPVTGYNLSAVLYKRGDYNRAQFYIRRINNGEYSNAQSLWLGIRVERRLKNTQAMDQLAAQLRRRFPQSPELSAYERGAFDD